LETFRQILTNICGRKAEEINKNQEINPNPHIPLSFSATNQSFIDFD
jgi:hypothetical protein